MVVGILQLELLVHGAESLKDKRRVVLSIKDRLSREHRVSVSEVGAQEMLNLAVLGVAMAGTEGRVVGQALDRIVAEVRAMGLAELGMTTRRVIHGEMWEMPEAPGSSEAEMSEAELAAEMLSRAEEAQENA